MGFFKNSCFKGARFKEGWAELRARREGRRHVPNNIRRASREIAGPTGWTVSKTWHAVDQHGDDFVQSFDRRLPPSTFVSERDRRRANRPVPVASPAGLSRMP